MPQYGSSLRSCSPDTASVFPVSWISKILSTMRLGARDLATRLAPEVGISSKVSCDVKLGSVLPLVRTRALARRARLSAAYACVLRPFLGPRACSSVLGAIMLLSAAGNSRHLELAHMDARYTAVLDARRS